MTILLKDVEAAIKRATVSRDDKRQRNLGSSDNSKSSSSGARNIRGSLSYLARYRKLD